MQQLIDRKAEIDAVKTKSKNRFVYAEFYYLNLVFFLNTLV